MTTTPRTLPAHTCPRCGGAIPRMGMEGRYPGALSRYDNETEVCSRCGEDEALRPVLTGTDIERDQWFDTSGKNPYLGDGPNAVMCYYHLTSQEARTAAFEVPTS